MNCQTGIDLWNKAKRLIPGGSQLLSKRSEMFLPNKWPSYYKKAKGVEIWDLDNNKFIDMTIMGVGACTLGYADPDVDAEVLNAIKNGSMSTLNCPEEIELAELLVELHPWANAVRFARTGGEIAVIAIRIARAFTKKDKIAFCGYHGWHDWYLSSNLADNANLDGHLLAGLDPNGVPRGLLKTALPFEYNKVEQLEKLVKENKDIGVIIVEPLRHQDPKEGFLERIREIANEIDAVLIFDEITSGWRLNVGGVHLLYDINPDMMIVAKAMSNGYPMAAVIGKGDIMDAAQTSFISSTYWTERIGPTAALATIRKMKDKNVPFHLNNIGEIISQGWKKLAKAHSLEIEVLPPNALTTFLFKYDNAQEIKTLFTQEMLKRGYLASSSVYVSYAHTEKIVANYLNKVNEVFEIISKGIKNNNISDLLEGPIAHNSFQRLT
ncbi:MAG: aminotransferase class III-fold pyridoxal phosphate-dependent enzyme [Candidatus Hodarchaeota archaeon]